MYLIVCVCVCVCARADTRGLYTPIITGVMFTCVDHLSQRLSSKFRYSESKISRFNQSKTETKKQNFSRILQ